MADSQHKGEPSLNELVVAMHLIHNRLTGRDIYPKCYQNLDFTNTSNTAPSGHDNILHNNNKPNAMSFIDKIYTVPPYKLDPVAS